MVKTMMRSSRTWQQEPRRTASETTSSRLAGAGRILPVWTPGSNGENGSLRRSRDTAKQFETRRQSDRSHSNGKAQREWRHCWSTKPSEREFGRLPAPPDV